MVHREFGQDFARMIHPDPAITAGDADRQIAAREGVPGFDLQARKMLHKSLPCFST